MHFYFVKLDFSLANLHFYEVKWTVYLADVHFYVVKLRVAIAKLHFYDVKLLSLGSCGTTGGKKMRRKEAQHEENKTLLRGKIQGARESPGEPRR